MTSNPRIPDFNECPTIDPELEQLLQNIPPIAPFNASTPIAALRARVIAIKNNLTQENIASNEYDSVVEQDREIPTQDQASIVVRIYSPRSPPLDGMPVIVLYHGGGFCLGGLESEVLTCRMFAKLFQAVVVDVDYRLAPEHIFPTAVYDAYDALKWVSANLDSLDVNATKGFIVGGISAGANLAATVSHLYRDDGISPPLTGSHLLIPSLMRPEVVSEKYKDQFRSHEQNKNAPLLDESTISVLADAYKGDPTSPLMSPFLFRSGHRNLPPTYFQICGLDPIRDEAIIYERVLREECNVQTRVDVYAGLPHGIWSWFPKAGFSKRQLRDSLAGMAWLLRVEVPLGGKAANR